MKPMKRADRSLMKLIERMLDEKLAPLKSLRGLKEAILTPEEDKVSMQWEKLRNKKLREMGFKVNE